MNYASNKFKKRYIKLNKNVSKISSKETLRSHFDIAFTKEIKRSIRKTMFCPDFNFVQIMELLTRRVDLKLANLYSPPSLRLDLLTTSKIQDQKNLFIVIS